MSVSLNGTNQYLSAAFSPTNSYPFTFSAWYNANRAAGTETVISHDADGSSARLLSVSLLGADGAKPVEAFHRWNANVSAQSSTGFTLNTWEMITGVFTAQNDVTVYLNGANPGNSTADAGSPLFQQTNTFRVGAATFVSLGAFFSGLIAEVAVWGVALNAAEVSNLYLVHPNSIRADDIVFYASYQSDFTSQTGPDLTPIGSPTISGNHPSFASGAGGGRDGGWLLRRRNPSGGLARSLP